MKKLALLCLLALTACATPEQLAARRQFDLQADYNDCLAYGWQPGTEGFANCRMQLDYARHQPVYYNDPYYGPGAYGPPVSFSFGYVSGGRHWR